jgi:hypothetical protein
MKLSQDQFDSGVDVVISDKIGEVLHKEARRLKLQKK